MQSLDNNTQAFLALVRGGLWEKDVRLSKFEPIDYSRVLSLAEEQSVVGLVAAGLEHVVDVSLPKETVLQFVGLTLQLEQRNLAMNRLISELVGQMRSADIYTLLVKGQGIAQCYERPLWRASGDVDFYLSEENFLKARVFFRPHVKAFIPDNDESRRVEMNYGPWVIELHANQMITLSEKANRVLDKIHKNIFLGGNVRSWDNDGTTVFLPSPNDDVQIIFTHFLNHFYKGGIGLRQVCDWCRLLWTYREIIDQNALEKNLSEMGLMSEWRAFAAFAAKYLGMPKEAIPLYDVKEKWVRKSDKICSFIIEVGNFGHNRDMDYMSKYPYLVKKICSMGRRIADLVSHARIFPMDSLRFFPAIFVNGLRSAIRGE